ncbi:MAG: DUF72 domain-containing protein [Bacteroidota bacterium]|nr:DUF72 domain-containing protein [Bacteroidota bacterium]
MNSPFYRLPKASTFENWRKKVPENFAFAVKASRYITHIKRLKDPKEPLNIFFEVVEKLEQKLAVILSIAPPLLNIIMKDLKNF